MAVNAFSTSGTTLPAVLGQSHGGATGVHGYSGRVNQPACPASTGVFGSADTDSRSVGVHGKSRTGRGGLFDGKRAQLRLLPSAAATHPVSGVLGDLFLDKNQRLWFCKGCTTWKQLPENHRLAPRRRVSARISQRHLPLPDGRRASSLGRC
jgi:hypothetical protein